jgi:hypothetical protein
MPAVGRFEAADFDLGMSGERSTAALGRAQFYARTRPADIGRRWKPTWMRMEAAVRTAAKGCCNIHRPGENELALASTPAFAFD